MRRADLLVAETKLLLLGGRPVLAGVVLAVAGWLYARARRMRRYVTSKSNGAAHKETS